MGVGSTSHSRSGARGARAVKGKLVLDPTLPLGGAVAAAMREVLEVAAREARHTAERPSAAVHGLRKSIRRARAVLQVTRPLLVGRTRASLDEALRAIQTRTSSLRDLDILLPVASGLRRDRALTTGARRALSAFSRELRAEQRRSRADGTVAATIADSAPELEAIGMRFALALPAPIEWGALERGLRAIYRRTRRAVATAREAPRDDGAFHDWRKRTKVLAYALELLAPHGGRRASKARKRFSTLAEEQGAVTDLIVLRNRLRPWVAARADEDALALMRELGERIERERRALERKRHRTFRRKPRAFVARVL
jgi:CHAD domain-containing protein